MKIMIVGGGGREHAIIKKLAENKSVEKIFALPGNGGISCDAQCVPIDPMDLDGLVDFAKAQAIDFAIVGPDNPLAAGAVDKLEAAGVPTFGPNKKAALIESSKVYAKELMLKYNIPTAQYKVFQDMDQALAYAKDYEDYPLVIKADGLALGKGVSIVENFQEAQGVLKEIMEDRIFGDSGNQVVMEEFLTGPEVTLLCFTDSKTLVPMVSSMDHKRVFDNDLGPNTGGMGVIAPNPFYTEEIAKECMEQIFLPTIEALKQEGRPFKGCLYFGLMLTDKGPKVIEYNARFGDPESQAVLPLLMTDLLTIMQAVSEENLSAIDVKFSREHSCCVIAASSGYPGPFETGKALSGLVHGPGVFHSGTKLTDSNQADCEPTAGQASNLVTSGGRVLAMTALGESLEDAIEKAYEKVHSVHFDNMYFRKDIGQKALKK